MTFDEALLEREFPEMSSLTFIDHGGQRRVFSGTHATDGEVVLKVFHPGTDFGHVLREITVVQHVRSSYIPEILDYGKTCASFGELCWIREKRVYRESVRRILADGPLESLAVLRLGLQLLEILAATEEARVVHCDAKPENILVTKNGKCHLIDF